MASPDFRFKQFTVWHDRCAMKVGTDGVLLAAWADLAGAETILDAGTGCGVIALICAQRSGARITAVEIDADAAAQAAENAAASPWSARISVVHSSLQEFAARTDARFDRIITNPPYFENQYKAAGARRSLARHTDTLPLDELCTCAARLLDAGGLFQCMLPVTEADAMPERAAGAGLHCVRKTLVLPRESSSPKRVLLGFAKSPRECVVDELAILRRDSDEPTDAYRTLTGELYLNF